MSLVAAERIDEIVVLRLNRPPVNAIDLELIQAAEASLHEVERDPKVRALVLTGAGTAFSAGLDLRKVPNYGAAELRAMVNTINRVVLHLYAAPMPVVAAINGHAIAGGLCLALACDYRVCVGDDCKLGLTETRAGIPYPAAPMAVLRAELPPHVARQLVLVARNVAPAQALPWGVVDELQPRDNVLPRTMEMARDLGSTPADAYARIKNQLRGETIEALRRIVRDESDPLLAHWFGDDARQTSANVLAGKAGT